MPKSKAVFLAHIHCVVRMKGLEPPRLTAPDPKSGAATNYATSAGLFCGAKITYLFYYNQIYRKIILLTKPKITPSLCFRPLYRLPYP